MIPKNFPSHIATNRLPQRRCFRNFDSALTLRVNLNKVRKTIAVSISRKRIHKVSPYGVCQNCGPEMENVSNLTVCFCSYDCGRIDMKMSAIAAIEMLPAPNTT